MNTPHNQDQHDFSSLAHEIAKRDLYPRLFGVSPDRIRYAVMDFSKGEWYRLCDGNLGIDVIVKVDYGLKMPLRFSIQERFRSPKFFDFDDITITSWNNLSDRPSELYKMVAQFFVYGVMDDAVNPTRFLRAMAVNVPDLVMMRGGGLVKNNNGNRNDRGQDFEAYSISQIKKFNLARLSFDGREWTDYYARTSASY